MKMIPANNLVAVETDGGKFIVDMGSPNSFRYDGKKPYRWTERSTKAITLM